MSKDNDRLYLPVLRAPDSDLPVLATGTGPQHEPAGGGLYPGWHSYSNQRNVRGIAIDSKLGEVWLATGGGVLRWLQGMDRYTRYGSEHGLPGNEIRTIAIDGSGQAWAAHELHGLYFFAGRIWRPYLDLLGEQVFCISTDDAGRLWAATASGVCRIDSPAVAPAVVLTAYEGDPPRALAATGDGDVWLCNSLGLHRRQTSKWMYKPRPDVLALAIGKGRLWIGAMSGLSCFDLAENKFCRAEAWPKSEIAALSATENGIWTASQGFIGLVRDDSWSLINRQPAQIRITSLAAGINKLWVGAQDGLYSCEPGEPGEADGLHVHLTDAAPDVIGGNDEAPPLGNLIQALTVQSTPNGAMLWVAAPSGLYRLNLDRETWSYFRQRDARDVRALLTRESPDKTEDEVLVASWSGGLQCLKQGRTQPEINDTILAVAAGRDGYWAAGWRGVYCRKGNEWLLMIPSRQLPKSGWVQALAQAKQLWIGTSAGLLRHEMGTGILTPLGEDLLLANVRALLAVSRDGVDQLFVGTGHGLAIGNEDGFSFLPKLRGRTILALLYDDLRNRLWIGTERGLFWASADGDPPQSKNANKQWKINGQMTTQDSGLPADRVTALALNRHEDSLTDLWVGTLRGLSHYTY